MKKWMFVCALLMLPMLASAATFGTKEEAKGMVEKALMIMKLKGKEEAYKLINDPDVPIFHDRDLYVFVVSIDDKATMIAHGAKPDTIGKDFWNFQDQEGNYLFRDFVTVVKEQDEGWVDYFWPNPITKKTAAKTSYVKRFDDEVLVGVGVYQ